MSTNYEVPHCATSSIPLEETLGIFHEIQKGGLASQGDLYAILFNPVASTIQNGGPSDF
jgi:hypothetical protein